MVLALMAFVWYHTIGGEILETFFTCSPKGHKAELCEPVPTALDERVQKQVF